MHSIFNVHDRVWYLILFHSVATMLLLSSTTEHLSCMSSSHYMFCFVLLKVYIVAIGAQTRDGNGYPLPETRWVFALLGYRFGSISLPMDLLMSSNGYPTGTWAWVRSSTTHTRKPMGF
jgi:hypothetical protein